MAQQIGEWVLGDDMRDLRVRLKNPDQTYRDLSAGGGHTCTLEGRRPGSRNVALSIVGVNDPDQVGNMGWVSFSDITDGQSLGRAEQLIFEVRVKVVQASPAKTGYTDKGMLTIVAWA